MDSYKEINRELILANQELKVQQSIFQKQIIILKDQLMEQLERRVISEKMIRMMLIDNFKNALKLVDPESRLLEILQDNEDENAQERCQQKLQPTQILQELRRSNSLHRRSSIVASPTKHLNYDEELRQREESYEGLRSSDNEEQDMLIEERVENSTEKLACIAEDVIQEEEEEEEQEQEKDESEELNAPNKAAIVQNTQQPQQNISIMEDMSITEIEEDSLLADTISEHVHDEEQFLENMPSPQVLINNKRRNACYLRRSPLQDVGNFECDALTKNLEKRDPTKTQEHPNPTNVVVKRGKCRSLFDNDSIQSMRHNSQRKGKHDEIEEEDISMGMKSFSIECEVNSIALSELTCGQFANAPSSTPNSSQWQDTRNSIELLHTTQIRASRRCKPKCLAEPKLNSKLRSDGTKTRKNTKKKNNK